MCVCLRANFGVTPAADTAAAACPRARARARGVRGIELGTRPGVHAKDHFGGTGGSGGGECRITIARAR
jgi:hypothetical protein